MYVLTFLQPPSKKQKTLEILKSMALKRQQADSGKVLIVMVVNKVFSKCGIKFHWGQLYTIYEKLNEVLRRSKSITKVVKTIMFSMH